MSLVAHDDDLNGLEDGKPLVFESTTKASTGVRVVRRVGTGGMAAVFQGVLEGERSRDISERAPRDVAIKVLLPGAVHSFRQLGIEASQIVGREVIALARVADHTPPTDFVIGFYGSGLVDVELRGKSVSLPWLLLEYVDGGSGGTSLDQRVTNAARTGGIDPIRGHKLVARILEGARVLHQVGVVHRDLKPENILVAGPIDDETPKIADCGIAKASGADLQTVAAFSMAYAAPEQLCSFPKESNALIGPWTDVHALAAIIWFVMGGEMWIDRAGGLVPWSRGERPSLTHAKWLHPGYRRNSKVVAAIDQVLQRAAASRLPPEVKLDSTSKAAALYTRRIAEFVPGAARYASVEELSQALMPLLEEAATECKRAAAEEGLKSAGAFRPTEWLRTSPAGLAPLAEISEVPARAVRGTRSAINAEIVRAQPGAFVFRPSARILGKFGERLLYFIDEQPHQVTIKPELQARVAEARWLASTPNGGFALVAPDGLLLMEAGVLMPGRPFAPSRASKVGLIEAAAGTSATLAIVTSETEGGEGGPELWRSSDGSTWKEPLLLDDMNGRVAAIAEGPSGMLLVGASRNGKKARGLVIGLDDRPATVDGLSDAGPLRVAVCGAELEAWAAADDAVMRIHLGTRRAERETIEMIGTPVAMALDPIGNPWLITTQAVLRRHIEGVSAVWKSYVRREPSKAPLGGIGFTTSGAVVIDTEGTLLRIRPYDVETWKAS